MIDEAHGSLVNRGELVSHGSFGTVEDLLGSTLDQLAADARMELGQLRRSHVQRRALRRMSPSTISGTRTFASINPSISRTGAPRR